MFMEREEAIAKKKTKRMVYLYLIFSEFMNIPLPYSPLKFNWVLIYQRDERGVVSLLGGDGLIFSEGFC